MFILKHQHGRHSVKDANFGSKKTHAPKHRDLYWQLQTNPTAAGHNWCTQTKASNSASDFLNHLEIKVLAFILSQVSDADIWGPSAVRHTEAAALSVSKHTQQNEPLCLKRFYRCLLLARAREKHFTSFTFSARFINRLAAVRGRLVGLDHSRCGFCFLNFHFPLGDYSELG